MNARRNQTSPLRARLAAAPRPAFALLLCVVLAGCRHHVPQYAVPVAPPISLEPANPPSDVSAIPTQPPPDFGPPPPVNPPAPPPRRRTGPKEESVPSAPPVDAPVVPADLAIGSLSTGVSAAPQVQQQARDMIASIAKRIAALSTKTADSQKREVRQVRHFLDQAQQAINTGDTEGAKNLATKASLLMDDLEKK